VWASPFYLIQSPYLVLNDHPILLADTHPLNAGQNPKIPAFRFQLVFLSCFSPASKLWSWFFELGRSNVEADSLKVART